MDRRTKGTGFTTICCVPFVTNTWSWDCTYLLYKMFNDGEDAGLQFTAAQHRIKTPVISKCLPDIKVP